MMMEPVNIEPRTPVLVKDPMEIAEHLHDQPGQWYRIAEGEPRRRGTFQQTAHRIKRGQGAFWPREGGYYEAVVKRDPATSRVSLNARWVHEEAGVVPDVALQSVHD